MRIDLCLAGSGNIGRHFAGHLARRHATILERHGLDIRLVTVVGSRGGVHSPDGLDPAALAEMPPGSQGLARLTGLWSADLAGAAGIAASTATILVDATPTDIWTGEPGLTNFRTALAKGMDVVTFAKGPLVKAFLELKALAWTTGARIKLSGATAAALPTIDAATYCLAGDDVLAFEGVLNGTSNHVLTRMADAGISCAEAVAEAVAQGVAEPDPRLDIEGWDTAAKTIILADSLFDTQIDIAAIHVEGIQNITPQMLRDAETRGQTLKLIGEARRTPDGIQVTVGPKRLSRSHPLAGLRGADKGIRFVAAALGELVITGGKGDPTGTVAAGLKDIINLAREKGLPLRT